MTTVATLSKFDATQISDVEMILEENRKVITVISEKEKIPLSEAEQLFSDTIRYLYLCSISEKSLSPNERLDLGWHHFILCTKEYATFCKRHIGYFIHHSPFTEKAKNELIENPFKETLVFAKSIFFKLSDNWYHLKNNKQGSTDTADCCDGGNCSNTGNCSHCKEE